MSLTLPKYEPPKARNRAMCRICHHVVESRFRHEWKGCFCSAIFVDGGHDYWRAGGNDFDVVRLGDYDLPLHAKDPNTHLIAWSDGTLSGYTAEEVRYMLEVHEKRQREFPGKLIYVVGPDSRSAE
jgi:hypothetical protein